jgi:hypothetical protein
MLPPTVNSVYTKGVELLLLESKHKPQCCAEYYQNFVKLFVSKSMYGQSNPESQETGHLSVILVIKRGPAFLLSSYLSPPPSLLSTYLAGYTERRSRER